MTLRRYWIRKRPLVIPTLCLASLWWVLFQYSSPNPPPSVSSAHQRNSESDGSTSETCHYDAETSPHCFCLCQPFFLRCHRSYLCPRDDSTDAFRHNSLVARNLSPGPVPAPARRAFVTVFSVGPKASIHDLWCMLSNLIVLHYSVRQSGSKTPFAVLASGLEAFPTLRLHMEREGMVVHDVPGVPNPLVSEDNAWLAGMMSKLNAWRAPYDKVVYLDMDCLVIRDKGRSGGLDHLFHSPAPAFVTQNILETTLDNGEKLHLTSFNAGVFVAEPSQALFDEILLVLRTGQVKSYDGGDQGLINSFFTQWWELPRLYNVLKYDRSAREAVPYGTGSHLIHLVGRKPVRCGRIRDCINPHRSSHHFMSRSFHRAWWDTFDDYVRSKGPAASTLKGLYEIHQGGGKPVPRAPIQLPHFGSGAIGDQVSSCDLLRLLLEPQQQPPAVLAKRPDNQFQRLLASESDRSGFVPGVFALVATLNLEQWQFQTDANADTEFALTVMQTDCRGAAVRASTDSDTDGDDIHIGLRAAADDLAEDLHGLERVLSDVRQGQQNKYCPSVRLAALGDEVHNPLQRWVVREDGGLMLASIASASMLDTCLVGRAPIDSSGHLDALSPHVWTEACTQSTSLGRWEQTSEGWLRLLDTTTQREHRVSHEPLPSTSTSGWCIQGSPLLPKDEKSPGLALLGPCAHGKALRFVIHWIDSQSSV